MTRAVTEAEQFVRDAIADLEGEHEHYAGQPLNNDGWKLEIPVAYLRELLAALAISSPREEPVAGDAVSREAAISRAIGVVERKRAKWANRHDKGFAYTYADEILAALRALPAASQWRFDMESAPKDGRKIWIAVQGHSRAIKAHWCTSFGDGQNGWFDGGRFSTQDVYAWHETETPPPLSPAPISVEETKG